MTLHLGQNRDKGALQRLVNARHLGKVQLRFQKGPEAQGDIGILSPVSDGIGHRNTVKGDGGFAAAQQGLDRYGAVVQVALAERVHPVPVQPCMQRVGDQHRVIDGAHVNAMARKHLGIVFHVLADFQDAVILQNGFQRGQHIIQCHLPRRQRCAAEKIALPLALMGQRDIAGMARLHRQRYAHQIGLHFVQRRGFGIDGHMTSCADAVDPELKRRHILHMLVIGFVKAGHFRCSGFRRAKRRIVNLGRLGIHRIGDTPGQGAELHFRQKSEQNFGIGVAYFQIVQPEIQIHVTVQLHQLARQADLVGIIDQRLAPFGLLYLLRPGQKAVEVTIFVDEQRRCLDPDSRRARDIVDRIPGQRLHIHHAIRADAEFLHDALRIDQAVLHRVQHFNAAADQLHQILVRTDDRHPPPRIARMAGKGCDDIIGLEPLDLLAGNVEGLGGAARQGDLWAQILGHRLAVGFVFRKQIVAERHAALVKDHCHMSRRIRAAIALDIALKHVAKARHRPDGQPVGFARQRRQRMIGAENEGRSVDQMQMAPFSE